MKKTFIFISGSILLILTSCSSMNSFQSPNVTPEGKYEVGAGSSFILNNDHSTLINIECFGRIGLNMRSDVGIKVFGLPGLSGGLMADYKYQIIENPVYVSVELGASYCYTKDLNYYDIYPMLIAGSERFYGGYRGIYRNGVDDDAKVEFNNYMNSFFLGCKTGPGPYLRPEIAFFTHDFKHGFFIFGLALQFK
ncbi:MAG: hypothetical protein K9N09_03375 [Candidatus Cloacimonetes bacterium]|nr:hypothetical protein [Candidatus Cloacimonadota bacterium]MCF7813425.1 hypothetical protein [Candidatus Cloacimonadota bacterium]MCF7867718.1 hypothetical protein [Candidatus Cloacimonadota bacterium]MCF7883196.1 hypothetical protein [Candidatus Cloacimonadota bacterium]